MNKELSKLYFIIVLALATVASANMYAYGAAKKEIVVLALSAHPDDEDGAALAYYKKIKDCKTYSVFYTRGEGGQNEIGSQLGAELGELRTKETLGAAVYLGSDVVFLGFPDFGFSKTARETFSVWGGKDTVLARLVYVIRALKPDVIVTNHDTITTKPNRQHGNHQAVGISAYEAFEKAADPLYHPEQCNGVIQPWQVKMLYFRFLNRGNIPVDSLVSLPTQRKDVSGETIDQIAFHALRMHRSQGMDKIALDSVPSFFKQHKYYRVRSNTVYRHDSTDICSGIEADARRSLPVAAIEFQQRYLKEPVRRTSKDVRANIARGVYIGLVKSYDETIEQILTSSHIRYTLIDSSMLASGALSSFTTIILDIRAYENRTDISRFNSNLLSYIDKGGNLVCFYHKPQDWNGKNYAPYPITLTNERVTEEDAPIRLLDPGHRLMSSPNVIKETDWFDWVQERSIYLPSADTEKTSPRYNRLLAMSDTDEQQPSTALLHADYGKGTYTYCSLALYRQLRNWNEGAVKFFFNLLSLPSWK